MLISRARWTVPGATSILVKYQCLDLKVAGKIYIKIYVVNISIKLKKSYEKMKSIFSITLVEIKNIRA
jgi:hypothetical protein